MLGSPCRLSWWDQDSIDACKDSGALYDTYHISKDSELAELIHFKSQINIGPYVAARVKEGWQRDS